MKLPIIAGKKPIAAELVAGEKYYFCTCGRSKNQPFCDGSHAGTSLSPMEFTAEKDGTAYLCTCKHTAGPPFCDGTHKKFSADQVGQEGPGLSTGDADST
jgi:CDGSH-type Zn-finger protein